MITIITRANSFQAIKSERSKRYAQILEIIENKEMTAREIEDEMLKREYVSEFDMNHVRPRITELVDKYHELKECGQTMDYKTNRLVAVFRRTTEQEKMELDNIKHIPVID